MKNNYFDSKFWKDPLIANNILKEIDGLSSKLHKNVNIMEVCGTHTMSIAASGIRTVIPKNINLISGPGCPVCVTSAGDIDRILKISNIVKDSLITTFGDMVKVPGTDGNTLSEVPGTRLKIVYSPQDALDLAIKNPQKEVVFIGVGFETTAPLIASVVKDAKIRGVKNFCVTPLFKLVPPALRFLLDLKVSGIDGFILPGHVSAIIGYQPYAFLVNEYSMPASVAGFEPLDILRSISLILKQLVENKPSLDVEYSRVVSKEGNKIALDLMNEVFREDDAYWRAVGKIEASGYSFSEKYREYDAFLKHSIDYEDKPEPKGCLCGKVLLGLAKPNQCSYFGKDCTPQKAIGPCMVSAEGACAAWYKYGIKR